MSDTTSKPVIFLAFANDRDDTVGYLRNLPDETRRLHEALDPAERAGLCEVEVRNNCTADDIFKVFQDSRYRNRIAIFHYGGHANGYHLLLESAEGQTAVADAGGLAAFLGQQRGLQLVFLNGCSTEPQTQGLLDANVPVVISTSRAIDDRVATDFSCRFYQGLAGGATVRTAYHEAEAAVRTAKGSSPRALYLGNPDEAKTRLEADRWPWNLYLRQGSERADQWNLPEAVDDPLFGLPPLPEQDLPETPYRHLNWFTRKDAEIFFGRGHQIRELYDRLTAPRTAPIILFYGQSGVGKSSILDAGLMPRLERDHEVRYLRRTQGGLLDTLQLAFLPEASELPIESAWQEKEERLGRPLIVFLDQVEELYTRPSADLPDELDQFLRVVRAVFCGSDRRPAGKLVLGFRKEWLAELESQLIAYELPRTKIFLEPLDRCGIVEVVKGPVRSKRLRERYELTIDDLLPELIADNLLEDPSSAIAPTLQILLTKMWAKATEATPESRRFSQNLYQQLKQEGILLRDFLDQQIAKAREQYPEGVDAGLIFDLLEFHTTHLGTANQRRLEEVEKQYSHVDTTLTYLLQLCQDLYLLRMDQEMKTSRLAHDSLAPLVREAYDKSDRPGQRAARILSAARVTQRLDAMAILNEQDLETLIRGRRGMRTWTEEEDQLVRIIRPKQLKQESSMAALILFYLFLMTAICLLLLLALDFGKEKLEIEAYTILHFCAIVLIGLLISSFSVFGVLLRSLTMWLIECLAWRVQKAFKIDIEGYRQRRLQRDAFFRKMQALPVSWSEKKRVAELELFLLVLAEHVDEHGTARAVRRDRLNTYCGIAEQIEDATKRLLEHGLLTPGPNGETTHLSDEDLGPTILRVFQRSAIHKARTLVQRIERKLRDGRVPESIRPWTYQARLVRENSRYMPPLRVEVNRALEHSHWLM